MNRIMHISRIVIHQWSWLWLSPMIYLIKNEYAKKQKLNAQWFSPTLQSIDLIHPLIRSCSLPLAARSVIASHHREASPGPHELVPGRSVTPHSAAVPAQESRPHRKDGDNRDGDQAHQEHSSEGGWCRGTLLWSIRGSRSLSMLSSGPVPRGLPRVFNHRRAVPHRDQCALRGDLLQDGQPLAGTL